jgi:hypothetical protein
VNLVHELVSASRVSSPATGARGQGDRGEEASPSRAEELGAGVLDALAGKEPMGGPAARRAGH